MSEWKSIYAHKWGNTTDGDTLYNKAIQYIKNNKSWAYPEKIDDFIKWYNQILKFDIKKISLFLIKYN